MSEVELVKKIKLLKTIKPASAELDVIGKNIYSHLGIEQRPETFIKFGSQPVIYFGTAFAVIFLAIIFNINNLLPNNIHTLITYTKITAASNQYEKAHIALADIQNKYGTPDMIKSSNSEDISQSLTLTNNELSNLKLKGEKGTYTSQQCLALYKTYLLYLEKLNKNIPDNGQPSTRLLKSTIAKYKELSEQKLHMYK